MASGETNWEWARGSIMGRGVDPDEFAKRKKGDRYKRLHSAPQAACVVEWCRECGEVIPPGAGHHRDGVFKQVPGGEKGVKSNKSCIECSPRS